MHKQFSYVDEAIDYLRNYFTMQPWSYSPRDFEEENIRIKIAEENINTLACIMEKGGPDGHFISHDRRIKIEFSQDKAPVFFQDTEQIIFTVNDFKKQKKFLDMIYSATSFQPLTGRDFDFYCFFFTMRENWEKYLLGNNKSKKDSATIFSCFQSEKRSFFVCSKIYYQGVCLGEHLSLPRQVKYPLFNGYMAQAAIVRGILLTDDLDIAGFNYRVQKSEWKETYPWVSFFAPENDLSRVDWEPLRKKRIFYIMKQHSGMSQKEMFQKGHDILDILFPKDTEKQIAGEFHFILFEPLTDVCNGTTDKDWLPFHMSVEDFRRGYSSIVEPANFSPPITMKNLFLNPRPSVEQKQAIIPELIPAQAVTLFYGCQNTILTKFMVSMVFSISQGKSFIDAWPHATPRKCLYIHNNDTNLNFPECLMNALSGAFPKLEKAGIEEIQKVIIDIHPQTAFLKNAINIFPSNPGNLLIHLDPSDPIIWKSFLWTSLSITPFEMDFIAWIDLICQVRSVIQEIELIVLDIPDILQRIFPFPIFWDDFRRFLNELRCSGHSVFLTGLPTWKGKKEVLNLEIDQIFRFDRKEDYSSGAVFEVYVERNDVSGGKSLPIKNYFSYGASTSDGPKRWTLLTKKISTDEKIKILKHYKNRTIREIALLTGWSIPLIKKLRRIGNLAETVPSRSPKGQNRKKKSSYVSLSDLPGNKT